MGKLVVEISKKLLPILMIWVMGMLVINKTTNTHSHIFANGSVVTHSHPYEKPNNSKSTASHHHTNAELFFLDIVGILFITIHCAFVMTGPMQNSNVSFYFLSFPEIYPVFNKKGRAPPAFRSFYRLS
jgi:hypothetical protein